MELKYFCKFCSSEPRALRCSRRGAPFGGAVLGVLGTPGLVCATREEPCPEDAAVLMSRWIWLQVVSHSDPRGRVALSAARGAGPRPRTRSLQSGDTGWSRVLQAPGWFPLQLPWGLRSVSSGAAPPISGVTQPAPPSPPCTRPVPPAAPACALPSAGLAHPTLSSYLRERRPHPGCQLDLQQRNLCDAPRGLMKTPKATSP